MTDTQKWINECDARGEIIAKLQAALDEAVEALEFYIQPRRKWYEGQDLSKWEYVEIKYDHDYEYYPNHDVALDALDKIRKMQGEK